MSEWKIVAYEVKMIALILNEYESGNYAGYPLTVRNAITESLCLHIRCMVDFLTSRESPGKKKKDDLLLNKLLTEQTPGLKEEIASLQKVFDQPKQPDDQSTRDKLNKHIFHLTKDRDMYKEYQPHLIETFKRIQRILNNPQIAEPLKSDPILSDGLILSGIQNSAISTSAKTSNESEDRKHF